MASPAPARPWRRRAVGNRHATMTVTMKDRLIKKFEDEIHALDRELKVELPREILRARELGDLRENAEYHAAKERQRLVESRISMLQKRVSEIHLLNVDRIPTDRSGFGSTLHVTESNGEKLVFQLVMPEDADAAKGLISTTSPIGRALLNKEPGDTVMVVTPGVGAVGALFCAVDGAQHLWSDKGFWQSPGVAQLYGWRPLLRLLLGALVLAVAVAALPVAAMALGLIVYPIDFILKMVGLSGG